ncbi:hypothetical protein M9435_004674 [Picochlorum sp. BPE23]|nr:hypothetical protein M9435_004674 [Picochlorum sp. BPE23]
MLQPLPCAVVAVLWAITVAHAEEIVNTSAVEDSGRCILQFDRWVIPRQGNLLSLNVSRGSSDLVGCCQECIETSGCNLWIFCNGLNGCEIPDVLADRINVTTLAFQGCLLWKALPTTVQGKDALEYLSSDVPNVVSSAVNNIERNAMLDGFDYYPAQILQDKELAPCDIPASFGGLDYSANNQEYCHIYEELETVAKVCRSMTNCNGFTYIQANGSAAYGRLLSGLQGNMPLETRIDPFSTTWVEEYTASSHSVRARIYWATRIAFCFSITVSLFSQY